MAIEDHLGKYQKKIGESTEAYLARLKEARENMERQSNSDFNVLKPIPERTVHERIPGSDDDRDEPGGCTCRLYVGPDSTTNRTEYTRNYDCEYCQRVLKEMNGYD